jgi:O-antigen ligase
MIFGVKANRLFYFSCFLVVFTLPLPISINNVAIGSLLFTWIFHSSWKEKLQNLKSNRQGYWVFAIFFTYCVSILYSTNLNEGLHRLETKLSLIGVTFVIFSSNLRKEQIEKILLFFVCSTVLIGLGLIFTALVRFLLGSDEKVFFYHELTSPISLHAIYFANYLCVCIFVLLFGSIGKLNGYLKWLLILVTIWLIVMLSALLVIGFLILALIVGVLLYLSNRTNWLRALFISISLLTVLVLLIFSVPRTREKLAQIDRFDYRMDDPDSAWNTVTLRLAMWRCALPVMSDASFIGVGVGDENTALQASYLKFNFKEGIRCNYNSHNQYFSTYIATGLLGTLFLLASIILPALYAFRQKDWLLFAFLSLIGFSFVTENILSVQKGVVFFSFFYSLLIKRSSLSGY